MKKSKPRALNGRDYPPGSEQWWAASPVFLKGGLVDCALRLLELKRIDRDKARALCEYAAWKFGASPPEAPWDKLKW